MGRRIRIPGLLDLLLANGPEEIRSLANDPALRRGPPVFGPPLNRMVQSNLLAALETGTEPLPSARPLDDPDRIAAQKALAGRLDAPDPGLDDETLDAIAASLRGGKEPLGPLCQQLIGRLFEPEYRASRRTWRAALDLDTAARSQNPLRRLLWSITGRLRKAQEILSERVGGDPAGVHATGIAVHTFLRAVENLDAALGDRVGRRTFTARAAVGRAMVAPSAVLRVGTRFTETAAGTIAPGTLVLMQLDDATAKAPDPRIAFLSESPGACPAQRLVPAMLAEIWTRATGEAPPVSRATQTE